MSLMRIGWIPLLVACGCTTTYRHEIDVSKLKDFAWNGKVRVTTHDYGLFQGWKVDHVEFLADDGGAVSVNTKRIEPEVFLIGDPQSHRASKVRTVRVGYWLIRPPVFQEKYYRKRVDWGDFVDLMPPLADGDRPKEAVEPGKPGNSEGTAGKLEGMH